MSVREAFRKGDKTLSRKAHTHASLPISEQGHRVMTIASADQLLASSGRSASLGVVLSVCLRETGSSAMPLKAAAFFAACLAGTQLLRRLAQRRVEEFERARETWEYDNFAEGEKREMVELLRGKGVSARDAAAVIEILGKREYRDSFVDLMMVEELGILPSPRHLEVALEAAVTLLAAASGAVLPALLEPLQLAPLRAQASALLFCAGVLQSRINMDSWLWAGAKNVLLCAASMALLDLLL